MTWKPDVCVYHGNCDDGFGAAWAVWMRWGNEIAYAPGVYGTPLPDLSGKHVLFVDFSTKRPQLVEIAKAAKSVVILDHHKTAEAELRDWRIDFMPDPDDIVDLVRKADDSTGSPIVAVFDMERSGAVLAWEFAHGPLHTDPPPTMLAYIQDRDLWRFAFGDRTKQFSAALRSHPMTFEGWSRIAARSEDLVDEGKAILRSHDANIAKFMADTYEDEVAGYRVPVVNVPYHYASDTAHALLKAHPEAPFTACWFRRGDGMVQWSLRSEDSREDVSEIAKKFGGGGHRNAAGFQVPSAPDPRTSSGPGEAL